MHLLPERSPLQLRSMLKYRCRAPETNRTEAEYLQYLDKVAGFNRCFKSLPTSCGKLRMLSRLTKRAVNEYASGHTIVRDQDVQPGCLRKLCIE
jgi:hypothetical protein